MKVAVQTAIRVHHLRSSVGTGSSLSGGYDPRRIVFNRSVGCQGPHGAGLPVEPERAAVSGSRTGGTPIRVGIHFVNFTLPGSPRILGPTLATTARIAEDSGVSVFTLMDHWFQMERWPRPRTRCSRATRRWASWPAGPSTMTLGLLVTGVTYRHPGLLAKTVTTLDVLSGGPRAAGHRSRLVRARAPRARRAVPATRRALRAARGDAADLPADVERRQRPLRRRHYRLAETICSPPPISSPRPPHPHRRQRRAKDPAARGPVRRRLQPVRDLTREIAHKLDVLVRHCEDEGRDPGFVDRTVLALSNPLDDPDRFLTQMTEYAALGIGTVDVMPVGDPVAYVTEIGERIVPALAQLGP